MSFPKTTTSFGKKPAVETVSPYDRAKSEWDRRIGTARAQAFHWRLIALLSVSGMIALGLALGAVSAHKEVRAYIVEVDRFGTPARTSLLGPEYDPKPAQVGYFLARLVRLVRARPLDPVVIRDHWKTAYAFLAGDAVHTMNAYAKSDPPLRTVEGQRLTRVVEISNVLQKSPRTYQVRWREIDYIGGVPQTPEHRTALFQIDFRPPRDEADVFNNPLGIYVVSFSWSREFTGPVASDALDPSSKPAPPQETTHAATNE